MITDEQKQIITNIALKTDYINCDYSVQRRIRERIEQKTDLTEKQIYCYITSHKDKLFQQAENRLENANPTMAPKKKRVCTIYTDEQKQIIANIILETDYINCDYSVQRQTRERIAQEIGLTGRQIYQYFCYHKDELIQQAENRLENANPTMAPKKKRVCTIYTDEQKQIIANIILETDYINCDLHIKKQTRERIAQETSLTEKQIYYYIINHKDELIQQAENRLENTTSTTQDQINIPQNISQLNDPSQLYNISQAAEEFSDNVLFDHSFSNMFD